MPEAISNLFQMASTEGWAAVMFNGMDAVGIDMQPQYEHSIYWSLFFEVFVIFGNFFIMNLFAGAVVMTFNKEKEILEKIYLLSDK
jgi:Ion transport protein